MDDLIIRPSAPGETVGLRSAFLKAFPEGRSPTFDEFLGLATVKVRDQRRTKIFRSEPGRVPGGPDVFLKLYLFPAHERLPTFLRRSTAEREFEALRLFASAGVTVPEPIGFAVRRRFGLVVAAAIAEEAIPEARDLNVWADSIGERARDPADAERAAAVETLGRSLAALHGRGIVHGPGGAHLRNILIRPGAGPGGAPVLVFTDIPDAHRAGGRALFRGRSRDVGRLLVNLDRRFGLEARTRFFAAYHAPGTPEAERRALEAAAERARLLFNDETPLARLKDVVRKFFRRTLMGVHSRPRTRST